MSIIFFDDVLEELGHKLSYDAIVNYAGNSFVEKSWEMIMDSNPMMIGKDGRSSRKNNELAQFFGNARIATKDDLAKMNAVTPQKES